MSKIEVRWYDEEQRILLYTFPEFWDWEDFADVKRRADAMLDSAPQSATLLMDVRATLRLPPSSILMTRRFIQMRHPKGRPIIIISENAMVRSLFRALKRILPRITEDLIFVETLKEALLLLKQWQER